MYTPDEQRWMAENGARFLDAGIGHPRVKAWDEISKAYHKRLEGQVNYEPITGINDVTRKMAEFANFLIEITVNAAGLDPKDVVWFEPEDVIMTKNGTHAFYCIYQATLEPKTTALVMPPFYNAYTGVFEGSGADVVLVRSDASRGFHPTGDQIRQVYEATRDNRNGRATVTDIILPHSNPTGASTTIEYARDMAEVLSFIAREDENGRASVTNTHDIVYTGLADPNDVLVYPFMSKHAQETAAVILSMSKILGIASECGLILTKDPELKKALAKEAQITVLSSPTLGQYAFAAGVDVIMDRDENGKAKYSDRFIEYGERYVHAVKTMVHGIQNIAEAYGVRGGDIFEYEPGKALYAFPCLKTLYMGKDVPDIKVFGNKSLREFVGVDPEKPVIETDAQIGRLWAAMGGTTVGDEQAPPIGLGHRLGQVFGMNPEDGYMRITCTEIEAQNTILRVFEKSLRVMGLEKVVEIPTPLDNPYEYRQEREAPDNSFAVHRGANLDVSYEDSAWWVPGARSM